MDNTARSCQYCGAPIGQNARFCDSCGQPVSAAFQGKPEPDRYSPPLEEPAPTLVVPPPPLPPPPRTAFTPPPPESVRRSAPLPSKRRAWAVPALIAVGAGCLVCCLGAVALLVVIRFGFMPMTRTVSLQPQETVQVEMLATPQIPETVQPVPAEPTSVEEPTSPPEPTWVPTTEAPPVGEVVSYAGVGFTYDPGLVSEVGAETIPAQSGADLPPWELAPEYTQFTFSGYPNPDNMHQPQILVYPVADYVEVNPDIQNIVDSLQALLADRLETTGQAGLPFLPSWNAGQIIQAQVRYLDFQNGSGLRYLTQFGQDISPINNSAVFYTFQGLTADGQYYVAAILPVSHPDLPDRYEIPNGDYEAFAAQYQQYIQETRDQLDGLEPSTFTPDLTLLDALIQSLVIEH